MKNPITKIVFFILFALSTALSTSAFAADPAPLVMLKNLSNQMITELDKRLGSLNDAYVAKIVRRILVPRVDVINMSQNVVGRTYWQSAPPALQKQFVTQFTTYVIRTYSTALASYDGETISFYPIRGYTQDQTRVQINSDINHRSRPAIRMQYRLVHKGGDWLIYDFSVDGISFVQNYRSQFASTLQQGGLSLLVQKLIEKNRAYNY